MSEETINLIMSEVEPIQVVKYIHPALRPDPPDFIIPSMKIKYEPNVSLPCSIGLEEFYADVEIEYYPHNYLLEFMISLVSGEVRQYRLGKIVHPFNV